MTKSQTLFLIVGLLSFIVYGCTLAPTITWRNDGVDSGDLATAVAVGGVPHPPGYPTYLILGEVFKLLPFGDIGYRLNLLSATCAALAVTVVSWIIYRTLLTMIQSQIKEANQAQGLIWLSVASASLTLAFSGALWSQAVIAEVYTLNVLFVALLLYGALQVQSANEKWLVPALSGLLGLSLGNHLSILLIIPLLILTPKARWRWRLIVAAFLTFCVGLSVYLIIPVRAATIPPVNWGGATTWPNFLWLVSAKIYRQFLFSLPWEFVPARIVVELRLLTEAFMGWGIPVGLLGLQQLVRFNRSFACGSLITFCLISIYAIGYNTTDSHVYLLPAFLIFSVWIGWGLYDLGKILQKFIPSKLGHGPLIIGAGIICLPFLSLWFNFPTENLNQDDEAYIYAQQSLQSVASEAVIITDDDSRTFALWYGRYALAMRPDVAIVNYNLLPYAWYRQNLHQTHPKLCLSDQAGRPLTTLSAFIELNLPGAPIYLATLQPPTLEGYRLEPVKHLQRVIKLANEG